MSDSDSAGALAAWYSWQDAIASPLDEHQSNLATLYTALDPDDPEAERVAAALASCEMLSSLLHLEHRVRDAD